MRVSISSQLVQFLLCVGMATKKFFSKDISCYTIFPFQIFTKVCSLCKMAVPSTIICAYCGMETPYYQLVSQIPITFCTQSFILSEIRGRNGELLKSDEYVCHVHEETFRIKFKCKLSDKPFSKSFSYMYHLV